MDQMHMPPPLIVSGCSLFRACCRSGTTHLFLGKNGSFACFGKKGRNSLRKAASGDIQCAQASTDSRWKYLSSYRAESMALMGISAILLMPFFAEHRTTGPDTLPVGAVPPGC